MAFYELFDQLCSEKGVTPTQVARDNKITQQTVSHWKTRGSTPNGETLKKLASYFSVTTDYLLGNVSEPFFYLDNERIIREINSYSDDDLIPENRITVALSKLNENGRRIAADRVEELTEIPRYKAAETAPQSPPASQEGKDTTPPPDAPETPPEEEWDRYRGDRYGGRRDE